MLYLSIEVKFEPPPPPPPPPSQLHIESNTFPFWKGTDISQVKLAVKAADWAQIEPIIFLPATSPPWCDSR